MIKIVFIGSKNMGVDALNVLSDFQDQGFIEIVAVVARADDDLEFWYKSVSKRARELDLPLFMPESMGDEAFINDVKRLQPDIGFCCFYPKLFPESFFSIPPYGTFNLHFAPLPRYRGVLPIPFAIINGENEHGVTMHKIDEGMDSGPIVSQSLIPIFPDDTGYDLYKRCEKSGLILFQETVHKFILANGKLPTREQDVEDVISYVKGDLKSLEVDLSWGIERIYNFVRAFDFPPFESPYIQMKEKIYRLMIRPDMHGIDATHLPYVEYKSHKIFLVDE